MAGREHHVLREGATGDSFRHRTFAIVTSRRTMLSFELSPTAPRLRRASFGITTVVASTLPAISLFLSPFSSTPPLPSSRPFFPPSSQRELAKMKRSSRTCQKGLWRLCRRWWCCVGTTTRQSLRVPYLYKAVPALTAYDRGHVLRIGVLRQAVYYCELRRTSTTVVVFRSTNKGQNDTYLQHNQRII